MITDWALGPPTPLPGGPVLGPLAGEERWARLAWSRIAEPGAAHVADWFDQFGPVRALQLAVSGRLVDPEDPARYAGRLAALHLPRAVEVTQILGARVLVPGDEEWPVGVDVLRAPPIVIYALGPGRLGEWTRRSVALVGSRSATDYGLRMAHDLAEGLVSRRVTVVSGAAFGIDGAAHRGALSVDGDTVAVLACGVDRPYPQAHTALIRRIAEVGLVVSEVPVGFAPYRTRFLQRNRLIATMTLGTVVVEAALRSGSLNTAKHCRDYHLPVAAVPGPVTSRASAGCHELIRVRGAHLVTDAADIMDVFGRIGEDLADDRRAADTPDAALEERDALIWSALPVRGRVSPEELSARTGESPARITSALAVLEIMGLAEVDLTGWRKVRRRPERIPR